MEKYVKLILRKEGTFIRTKAKSVQKWLPYKEILKNGIIKLKDSSYVKIIKVEPINFYLKSDLEKQAILHSYKTFLQNVSFPIQILIQSKKEDLSKQIKKIKENEEKNILYYNEYIKYLEKINENQKSSCKNFFILIKKSHQAEINIKENDIIQELEENYFQIKEALLRCGNFVSEITEDKQTVEILISFLHPKIF